MPRHGENIRKRKDGRWEARYIKGYDANGKAQYGFIYRKSYNEVKAEKQRILGVQYGFNLENPMKVTVSELSDLWLAGVQFHVKESTYAKYLRLCEKYIKPHIGNRALYGIESKHLEFFTQTLLTEGSVRGKGGLAPKTVSDIQSILRQILRYGIEHHYRVNPHIFLKQPKREPSDIRVLTRSEQKVLEKALYHSEDLLKVGVLLDLYTGMRIGELCALRWDDFDFENGTVYIQRSISRIQDTSPTAVHKTKVIIDRPKTECSNRFIPLPTFLREHLKRFRRANGRYVLTGTRKYMEPRLFLKKYKKILQECRLGNYNFHALRHTFATRCVENGFDIKSLSEILGHSDVKTTLSRYVHPSIEMKKTEMEKLSDFFLRSQNCGMEVG